MDAVSGKAVKLSDPLQLGDEAPLGVKIQYLPRIRCNDCPGKLYTAAPGQVEADFEVHLRNRNHRLNVERRQQVGPLD